MQVFKGWVIIPQLESVMVSLLGPYTAAGSADGVIEFSFRAVTESARAHSYYSISRYSGSAFTMLAVSFWLY